MQSLRALIQLAASTSPGPSPSFGSPHLVLAFLMIGESGTIGRQALAARSGLKEGPTRTVLRKLRSGGYVEAHASGCYLSSPGKKVYGSLRAKLSSIVTLEGSKLTMGALQTGLVVRGAARLVRGGLEQRDAAIGIGAAGATTLVFKEGKFTIPGGSSDCEKDFPGRSWASLRNSLRPADGDVVIISGAKDEVTARLGAVSAALTLL